MVQIVSFSIVVHGLFQCVLIILIITGLRVRP